MLAFHTEVGKMATPKLTVMLGFTSAPILKLKLKIIILEDAI